MRARWIWKRTPMSDEDVQDIRREIDVMERLPDNIVCVKEMCEDERYVHVVVELGSRGEFFDPVGRARIRDERRVAELIRIVVKAVADCHSAGVMHRDVTLDKFMIGSKLDGDLSLEAIDFGSAVFFESGQVFTELVGTVDYTVPEVILKRYGSKADVWSCGVVLHELLSGDLPFWGVETRQEHYDAIVAGYINMDTEPWLQISDSTKDLVRKMLCKQPSERPTALQILRHPWFHDQESAIVPAPRSRHMMRWQDGESSAKSDNKDEYAPAAHYPVTDVDRKINVLRAEREVQQNTYNTRLILENEASTANKSSTLENESINDRNEVSREAAKQAETRTLNRALKFGFTFIREPRLHDRNQEIRMMLRTHNPKRSL